MSCQQLRTCEESHPSYNFRPSHFIDLDSIERIFRDPYSPLSDTHLQLADVFLSLILLSNLDSFSVGSRHRLFPISRRLRLSLCMCLVDNLAHELQLEE